jgi:hypothetical protein
MEYAGFDGRLGLNSFIQTGQVYTYEIPMLPKPIPVYPMGEDFVPYPYPWGQFLSHTRTLIGEFPMGYRVSGPH